MMRYGDNSSAFGYNQSLAGPVITLAEQKSD